MLQFLQPTGLFALSAAALPVLLHLWRKPLRTVRLGSLRFLTHLLHRRLRDLRWRERLLLFARVLLLTALALFLAQPRWQPAPSRSPIRWALISSDAILEGEWLAKLQRLQHDGYGARRLTTGFPALSGSAPVEPAFSGDAMADSDLWSLLREVDFRAPPGSKVAVFSPGRLAALHGSRPVLRHCQMEWMQTPARDGGRAHGWIQRLTPSKPTSPDDVTVEVQIGVSDAANNHFVHVAAPVTERPTTVPNASGWPLEVARRADGSVAARLTEQANGQVDGQWMTASQAPKVRVVIVQDAAHAEEARYLEAAAKAVAANDKASRIHIEICDAKTATAVLSARTEPVFVFWLDDASAPPELVGSITSRGGNVLFEPHGKADGAAEPTASWFTAAADAPASALLADPVRLWRRSAPERNDGAALWRDGFGSPLLEFTPSGSGGQWFFHGRFLPDWNALPLSSALPAAVSAMLTDSNAPESRPDRDFRIADPEQSKAVETPAADRSSAKPDDALPQKGDDLQILFWMIGVAAFAGERLLSRRLAPRERLARQSPLARQPLEAAHP